MYFKIAFNLFLFFKFSNKIKDKIGNVTKTQRNKKRQNVAASYFLGISKKIQILPLVLKMKIYNGIQNSKVWKDEYEVSENEWALGNAHRQN